MRILAIETSSRRGSVALVEAGRVILTAENDTKELHAERSLPMVSELISRAGWATSTLDRIAVGIGPGLFTGLRVGIALGTGIGIALQRPVLGIGAHRAMARAAPASIEGLRCPLLDAQRGELFAAVYDPAGRELIAPRVVARERVAEWFADCGLDRVLDRGLGSAPAWLGEVTAELANLAPAFRSLGTDLPDAGWVGVCGGELAPESAPPEPLYVRGAGATLPKAPRGAT